ncbi:MAG: extracellular solute-binding protein [Mobilitalea sp.]
MKRRWNKTIVLVLTYAMIMSTLSGCKKEMTRTDTTMTDTTAVTKGTAAEAVAGIKGWTAFDEKVTITIPVYDRSEEGYPAVDDNYWTRWIQTEFGDQWNVEVKFVAIPRKEVLTKYSQLIAAEETPTILMEYDYPKVAQWAQEGAMQTIDLNAFAQVAPNYYQKMVDNNQLPYTKLNEDTYFLLTERPYYNTGYTYVTLVRKDWLDAVGKEVPINYTEYAEAIEAIMAAGLTDQAPIGLSLPTAAYVANFPYRDFPVDEKEWVMHSSLGTASLTWKPTYKLLKRQNAEYNKGYISKEYDLDDNAIDSSQAKTDFVNGKTYSYGNYLSANVEWLVAFFENNPDAELAVQSITNVVEEGVADVPAYRSDNPFGMIVGFSALADENQLKAAWMYMEWMSQEEVLFTLENGIEGVTYKLGEDGLPVVDGEYRGEEMLNHNCNIDMTCIVHASKVTGTVEQSIAAVTPQGIEQDLYEDLLKNYTDLVMVSEYGYTDTIFTVPMEAESEYSASLLSLYQEYSVQLTKCAPSDFDSLYAELCQKYLDAGYQEIIDERLAAYEAGNTTRLPK